MTELKQPKIRFKGHINDWEQRKLKKVFDVHTDFVSNGSFQALKENVTLYNTENYAYMIRLQDASNLWKGPWLYTDKKGFDFLDKSTVFENDILMSDRGTIGKFFLVPKLDKPMTLSSNVVLLRSLENNNNFIYYMLNTKVIDNQIKVRTTPGVQPMISKTEFKKITTHLPNIEEQTQIGNFFKTLDDTITLHQQKLEVTKQFKQTMLKKMFPKNGETTPEIRFKGFTDDWEKCKLEDLCSLSTGKLDANAMTIDGKYSFFTSGEKVYKTDTFAFDGDAILIAGNGNVGLQHTYSGKFNAYQRTYVLMDFKINKEILSNQITLELPKVLRRETRVGVIPYIVKDMLTELPISYPRNVKEQTLISEYFNTLNSNIFNIECRLENLLNLKQTMLKKLYI